MKRILIVEDEPQMAGLLKQALEESGFDVSVAHDGRKGLELLRGLQHDLVVLDIMLPRLSGFEVIKLIREEGISIPVLIITAKDHVDDRVKGLDLGADDYLVKPFPLSEFLARVRAQIRRQAQYVAVIECGPLELDTGSRRAKRGDRDVYLSVHEYALLELLMRNVGRPVTKLAILQSVWDGEVFRDDNIIEVYVNRLRRKIEKEGEPRLLHTLRGRGYMISSSGELAP